MLKKLMLQREIEIKNKVLSEILEKVEELNKREADLEKIINEVETDDEKSVVEEEVAKFETDSKEVGEEKEKVEKEIADLEAELEELNDKDVDNAEREIPQAEQLEKRDKVGKNQRVVETNVDKREFYNNVEVREFMKDLRDKVERATPITGGELIIPDTVIARIYNKVGEYTTLASLVNTVDVGGTSRVVIDGGYPEAIWTEMCASVQEILIDGFTQIELDGYKVGGYVPMCRAYLEDTLINFGEYILNRIAVAIAKAVDKAILKGTGSTGKQPEGILPAVTTKLDVTNMLGLIQAVGTLDIDTDGVPATDVVAVMKRSTFYKRVLPETYLTTSDGRIVAQSADTFRLVDGTRVVFSANMNEDEVLIGDFKKGYILARRAGIRLEQSDDVRFIEDERVFKGVARYDGKVVSDKYFVLATYKDEVPGA